MDDMEFIDDATRSMQVYQNWKKGWSDVDVLDSPSQGNEPG